MEVLEWSSILTIAILAGFGHCIGMCGGIVMTYASMKMNAGFSKSKIALCHLLYSMGRISTYMIIGAVFGALGAVVSFQAEVSAVFFMVIGVFMVGLGLSILGKLRFLNTTERTIESRQWYKRAFVSLLQSDRPESFYLLGIMNGFIPCGLVYFFALAAAASGSVLEGVGVMVLFGLGTVPALFGLGVAFAWLRDSKARAGFNRFSGLVVIAFGIYTLYKGVAYFVFQDAAAVSGM